MISRALLLAAAIGWSGSSLIPKEPLPLTAAQLQVKGKQRLISNLCLKKKKSKKVKEICEKWQQ